MTRCYSAAMTELAPAEPRQRIEAIDTIRGFALLGILLLNILAFGLPFRAYTNPTVDGAVDGIDFGVFFTIELLFEGSMRALFSMLFGVGIAMFATSGKGAAIHYRRQLLLFAFGLVDAFVLLWTGDILTVYALAGMILYLCRNWRARSLTIAAGCMFAYLAVFYAASFAMYNYMPDQAAAAEARIAAAEAPSPQDQALVDAWSEIDVQLDPPNALLEREARKFRGTYAEAFVANAQELRELLVWGCRYCSSGMRWRACSWAWCSTGPACSPDSAACVSTPSRRSSRSPSGSRPTPSN